MESSVIFPPVVKSPIYTASSTMHEPNSNYSAKLPTPANVAGATSIRPKPQQPPLYIPPGHVALRLLCHASRVGGLIGKSGSVVKRIQQLTNSYIRVEDLPESGDGRVIIVVSSPAIVKQIKLSAITRKDEEESNWGSMIGRDEDEEWFDVSAAQEGIVRVFERVVEVAAEGDAVAGIGGVVSCRLLVSKNQGGVVIGKGGKVVEKIRKDTGCRIKVLTTEKFSSMDEIVEVEGLGLAVKKALVAITGRLQEFPPLERTRTYETRPPESESLPIETIDPPMHQSSIMQPVQTNSINDAWGDGPSLESEKVSTNMSSGTPQREVVFKILCPSERVGSIIGKGGSIIKALQNETGASVSIGLSLAGCDERLITITAMESVESEYSPAQKATIAVFNRSMETGLVKEFGSDYKGSPVTARILVPSNQVGCLLGKGGVIISEMRKVTGTGLRIIGGNQVPKCASENNEVLQITGNFANVQDAIYKVTGRLRDNMFSMTMSNGNASRNSLRTEDTVYGRVRGYPPFGSHLSVSSSDNLNDRKSLTQSMDHLAISSDKDRLTSPTISVNQENAMATGGRLYSVVGDAELGSRSRAAILTDTSVEIVVPDAVIGFIYGVNGSNLTRLQQISGAKVKVHEPRPGITHRIVVISGTPDETLAAQSLLQAFILAGS